LKLTGINNIDPNSKIVENKKLKKHFFVVINKDGNERLWELWNIEDSTLIGYADRSQRELKKTVKIAAVSETAISIILEKPDDSPCYEVKIWYLPPVVKSKSQSLVKGFTSSIPKDDSDIVNALIFGSSFASTLDKANDIEGYPSTIFNDTTYTIIGDARGRVLMFSTLTGEFLYQLNSFDETADRRGKPITSIIRLADYVFAGSADKVSVFNMFEPESLPLEVFTVDGSATNITCRNGVLIVTSVNTAKVREEIATLVPTKIDRVKCSQTQFDVSPYKIVKRLLVEVSRYIKRKEALDPVKETLGNACENPQFIIDVPNTLILNIYSNCSKLVDFVAKNKKSLDKPAVVEVFNNLTTQIIKNIDLIVYMQSKITQSFVSLSKDDK